MKPSEPIQFSRRFEPFPAALKTRRRISAAAVITTKRIKTAHDELLLKSSPHHLMLVWPDQIENDEPSLNECRNTKWIGMNMKSMTSVTQMAISHFMPSIRRARPGATRRTLAIVR